MPRRGDSAGWQVSALVCTLGKCRLCDPSVTPPACQLPLAREPFCARYRYFAAGLVSSLPPGGRWLGAQPQDGGSQRGQRRLDGRRWYLPRSVRFLASIIRKHPVKLAQGIGNYEQVQTHKQTTTTPPAGSLSHLRRQLPPVGSYGACTLPHWRVAYGKVPAVNPSVKNQRFLPAPFSKGACGESPLTISHAGVPPVAISHGNLQQIVTAPPVPGIGGLPKPPLPKGGGQVII